MKLNHVTGRVVHVGAGSAVRVPLFCFDATVAVGYSQTIKQCQRGAPLLGRVNFNCRIDPNLKPGVVVISEGTWVKDFPAGDPYSLTHELVSATSENYAFFDTLVEVETA